MKAVNSESNSISHMISRISSFIDKAEARFPDRKLDVSLLFETLYKLEKKRLYISIRSLFFEKNEGKIQVLEGQVKRSIIEITASATKSLQLARDHFRGNKNVDNGVSIKVMLMMKEIDLMVAYYFRELYIKNDLLKGLEKLIDVKRLLVKKIFEDKLPISDEMTSYFDEELALLETYVKLHLLSGEVDRKLTSLRQEWERDAFGEVAKNLKKSKELFRFEIKESHGYRLRMTTSAFAGQFSEYVVYFLCREFIDNGARKSVESEAISRLITELLTIRDQKELTLNYVLSSGLPDIDIRLGTNSAILLKNGKIDSDEVKKIWNEIETCEKAGFKQIYYAVNFMKNLDKLDYIRRSFENIKRRKSEIDVVVMDLEDLVTALVDGMRGTKTSKVEILYRDIMQILDYQ